MFKYLLLTPLKGSDFNTKNKEILKQLKEAGCGYVLSTTVDDHSVIYPTAATTILLDALCEEMGITGSVVEYTAIFDHIEED